MPDASHSNAFTAVPLGLKIGPRLRLKNCFLASATPIFCAQKIGVADARKQFFSLSLGPIFKPRGTAVKAFE